MDEDATTDSRPPLAVTAYLSLQFPLNGDRAHLLGKSGVAARLLSAKSAELIAVLIALTHDVET
ncbi:hypothetical protein B0H19DRAFT_1277136 [Mycena capillaripes]|nr:hypothetical protein B0H19DRAFT_1277136 [Mycena capillaripes]